MQVLKVANQIHRQQSPNDYSLKDLDFNEETMNPSIRNNLVPDEYYSIETTLEGQGNFRVGGVPPEGIVPMIHNARYFSTLPVDQKGELYMSIFLNFDLDMMFAKAFRILSKADNLVEVLIHLDTPQSKAEQFSSELSPCNLKIFESQKEDIDAPYGYSKLGGTPFILKNRNDIDHQISEIISNGFTHFVQFAFPLTGQAMQEGNWPFADGIFHLFIKKQAEDFSWCCFWQY